MKRKFFLFFIALVSLFPIFSQNIESESLVLSVDKAVELGLANNFSLKTQAVDLAGKLRNKNNAWNVLIPDITASVTLNRSNTAQTVNTPVYMGTQDPTDPSSFSADEGIYDYVYFSQYKEEMDPWSLVGNISAQLALSPAMINGVVALKLDYENALLEMESTKLSTKVSIKNNFYNLLLLKEQIKVLEKNKEITKARLESIEKMYEYGYVTELDVLKTKAGLSSFGPTLLQMENGYKQLKMAFLMELGLKLNENVKLEGKVDISPELLDADKLVNTYMADRIDIQQLTVSEEMLENAKSATANGRLPALVMGFSYSPYRADPFNSEAWENDSFSGDNGSFSVTLSLPIEDWIPHSATWIDIKKAQDGIDSLAYNKKMALLGAEMEIRSLVMTLNASVENMKVLNETISLNQSSYKMSLESYNNGQLSFLDLETAENDLLQAELDLVAEKFNYISSLLKLEKAINRELN